MRHWILPGPRGRRALARGAAWLFIIVSLGHLAWAIDAVRDGPGPAKLYHTVVDDRSYDAWGLTYTGWLGLIGASAQALLVIASAAATVLPWPRALPLRRTGHVVLCAWAALFAANLLRLAAIDHRLDTIATALLMGALFACTVYRAVTGWSLRPSPPEPAPG